MLIEDSQKFINLRWSMIVNQFKSSILVAAMGVFLIGCSSTDKDLEQMPVEQLYNLGKDALDNSSYSQAAKYFSEVERQHPYSAWSLRAQLMAAYSYYEAKKYDEAIEGYSVFIQLHPGHENIPYAYYMIGLCYYEQIPATDRAQESTEKAKAAFQEVVNRFKGSPYAKDARFKLDLILDHFAGKEMDVGRFYLNKKSYTAALNRFRVVVDQYQTSSHTPEALHRMVECYVALGIMEQAKITAAILGHNYPGSPWYADTYTLMTSVGSKTTLKQKPVRASVQVAQKPKVSPKPPVN